MTCGREGGGRDGVLSLLVVCVCVGNMLRREDMGVSEVVWMLQTKEVRRRCVRWMDVLFDSAIHLRFKVK